MIRNFKHRGLRRLYARGDRSGLRPDIAGKAELYLSILDTAVGVEELDVTGFGFHPLRGDKRGLYSVYVSRNHRMIFGFEDGEAFDVDLVDYH
jgi:toxin HigB-1